LAISYNFYIGIKEDIEKTLGGYYGLRRLYMLQDRVKNSIWTITISHTAAMPPPLTIK